MLRTVTVVVLLSAAACGGGGSGNDDAIDAAPSPACAEANGYQDLATIETKIFKPACTFSGCHNGTATAAGRIDLRENMAFAHLVDFDSAVNTGRKLVVPNDPAASYLMLMLGDVAPGDANPPTTAPPAAIGLMPQNSGGQLLCAEKRGAIKRWIMAGAPAN
ncbi:MAG: hypothetical protein KF773_15740 [Deltaproteobacteria bacterium]|nr:hypothetical protein [Deltaproteobacteria bacterium]